MGKAMLALAFVLTLVVTAARAADAPHAPPQGAAAPMAHPHQRPVLPEKSPLPGTTIILIVGLFLAAAAVGPMVRYHAPEEIPEASSHGEHGPGAHDGHGHGHGH